MRSHSFTWISNLSKNRMPGITRSIQWWFMCPWASPNESFTDFLGPCGIPYHGLTHTGVTRLTAIGFESAQSELHNLRCISPTELELPLPLRRYVGTTIYDIRTNGSSGHVPSVPGGYSSRAAIASTLTLGGPYSKHMYNVRLFNCFGGARWTDITDEADLVI